MRKGMEHFINNPIYTITAEAMSNGRNNIEVVGKMLEAGIKFIQYREKEKPALERYQECMQLVTASFMTFTYSSTYNPSLLGKASSG